MRLLLDACLSPRVAEALAAAGHDVEWAGSRAEPAEDRELLERAYAAKRILITLDRDFATLAVALGYAHCGIIRLAGSQHAEVIQRLVERFAPDLQRGAVITASPTRVRVRVTPQRSD
jgi:predicted nuclease of predicted toxin-antitoxin system